MAKMTPTQYRQWYIDELNKKIDKGDYLLDKSDVQILRSIASRKYLLNKANIRPPKMKENE